MTIINNNNKHKNDSNNRETHTEKKNNYPVQTKYHIQTKKRAPFSNMQ